MCVRVETTCVSCSRTFGRVESQRMSASTEVDSVWTKGGRRPVWRRAGQKPLRGCALGLRHEGRIASDVSERFLGVDGGPFADFLLQHCARALRREVFGGL